MFSAKVVTSISNGNAIVTEKSWSNRRARISIVFTKEMRTNRAKKRSREFWTKTTTMKRTSLEKTLTRSAEWRKWTLPNQNPTPSQKQKAKATICTSAPKTTSNIPKTSLLDWQCRTWIG